MSGADRSSWQLSFQVSPIILTNGIAANLPGGAMPIVSLTQSQDFPDGLLSGSDVSDLDSFFAQFKIAPNGATLVDQAIGTYPFANQSVAANAVIENPLAVSLLMMCPANGPGGYGNKLSILTSLKGSLDQHNASGGTYTVITPSYVYVDALLVRLQDVSPGDTNQPQTVWQFDFFQPLLTLAQATSAQNALISKLTSGTAINGQPAWSGVSGTVGQPPSLAAPSLIPAASGTVGTGTGPNQGSFGGTSP